MFCLLKGLDMWSSKAKASSPTIAKGNSVAVPGRADGGGKWS